MNSRVNTQVFTQYWMLSTLKVFEYRTRHHTAWRRANLHSWLDNLTGAGHSLKMAPPLLEERSTSLAGRGLFTAKEIQPCSLLLKDKEPFVAVLDSPLLTKACAWCFFYLEEANPEDGVKLSVCSGCKILRYCSKVRDGTLVVSHWRFTLLTLTRCRNFIVNLDAWVIRCRASNGQAVYHV